MFDNLISEPLVSNIIKLSKQIDDGNLFHNESIDSMKSMIKLEFISKVFEANLMDENFLLKKWADYEIPHLLIYQDNIIDLKYHIFSHLPIEIFHPQLAPALGPGIERGMRA